MVLLCHIAGTQGSGKTYLCNKLKKYGYVCKDLDDFFYKTMETLSQKTKKLDVLENDLLKMINFVFFNHLDKTSEIERTLNKIKTYENNLINYFNKTFNHYIDSFLEENKDKYIIFVGIASLSSNDYFPKFNCKYKFFIKINDSKLIDQYYERITNSIFKSKQTFLNFAKKEGSIIEHPVSKLIKQEIQKKYYVKYGYKLKSHERICLLFKNKQIK